LANEQTEGFKPQHRPGQWMWGLF